MLFTVTDDNSGVTRYDYDTNGKLAKIIDADGNDTEYSYDLFDRLTETKYADNSTEDYSYDKNSNLYVLTRPNAATITHTYDALNRLTAKDYSDSTPDVTYSYDLGSRMLTADNSASEIDFTYDHLNRLDDETQKLNSSSRLVQYAYDNGGRRLSVTYPSTKVVSYTYDDNSNLDLVKIGSVTLADYDYDVLNRRSQKTLSYPTTDQAAVYSFDIGNQLTSIANKILPSTNIATYAYTSFDAVGNRAQMQRTYTTGSAVSTNYTYNDLYELTGTSGAQSHSLTYDAVGNRDTVDSVSYTPNNLNQYTAVGSATYTNSSNGNITSDGTSTFGYDAENRLVSFDTTGTSNDATYAYDALGRRVKKTVNGTSTYFVYDGDNIIADYSSSSLLREYIHGDAIDEILAMDTGSGLYYYHYDGLGSVTEVTDDSGAIAENYTYDVYGAPSVTTSSINNRYRFTGREYDEESGLYHYRARAYSPSIGRFMQRDPIGYMDSMNLYKYVANNPLNFIDPLGLEKYNITIQTEIKDFPIEKGIKSTQEIIIDTDNNTVSSKVTTGTTDFGIKFQPRVKDFNVSSLSVSNGVYRLSADGTTGSALYPFGNIDYNLGIRIDEKTKNIDVYGSHDGFPSYSITVNGVNVYDYKEKYIWELYGNADDIFFFDSLNMKGCSSKK